jgi:hypothetical protein
MMFFDRAKLKVILWRWRAIILEELSEELMQENVKLKRLINPKPDSNIWVMRKEDLVEAAICELKLTRTQAEEMTVVRLREKLRAQRAIYRRQIDPRCQIPKGLEKMTRDQLSQICLDRGLEKVLLAEGSEKVTRPKMIVAIREDVERWIQQTKGEVSSPKATPKPSVAPTSRESKSLDEDGDETMGSWQRC